jgi:hypothetical protein
MRKKRIHYFVDKEAIAKSIELYEKYVMSGRMHYWDELWDSLYYICPDCSWEMQSGLTGIMQNMHYANTLTVDRLYAMILASGLNTKEVEIDD